jgi:hypothetical protein
VKRREVKAIKVVVEECLHYYKQHSCHEKELLMGSMSCCKVVLHHDHEQIIVTTPILHVMTPWTDYCEPDCIPYPTIFLGRYPPQDDFSVTQKGS